MDITKLNIDEFKEYFNIKSFYNFFDFDMLNIVDKAQSILKYNRKGYLYNKDRYYIIVGGQMILSVSINRGDIKVTIEDYRNPNGKYVGSFYFEKVKDAERLFEKIKPEIYPEEYFYR